MNSKNSIISDPQRYYPLVLLNMLGDKYVALLNFSIYYTWKNIKKA